MCRYATSALYLIFSRRYRNFSLFSVEDEDKQPYTKRRINRRTESSNTAIMAKSSRSSSKKFNNQRKAASIFGPAETARQERLSAKLLELAKQAKPEPAEMKIDGMLSTRCALFYTFDSLTLLGNRWRQCARKGRAGRRRRELYVPPLLSPLSSVPPDRPDAC